MIIDSEFSHYANLEKQLEEELTVEVTEVTSIDRALSFIQILPDLDFILLNINNFEAKEFVKLENFLIDENIDVALLVIGAAIPDRQKTTLLKFNIESMNFLDLVKDIFIKNDIERKKKSAQLFTPVEIGYILEHRETPFPVDFFLRIKRSEDEFQFIKRLHANELFDDEEIEKFKKHNVTQLFIQKNDYKTFLDFSLKINLNKKPASKMNSAFNYHLTREVLSLMGVDEELEKTVSTNIKEMEANLASNEALANYLNLIKKSPDSFAYAHSSLVALILNKVVGKFDWDSKMIREKICYAAFFHDLTLVDDKLTRVHSEEDLYKEATVEYEFLSQSKLRDKVFKDFEVEQILQHALNAAIIIEKIPSIPSGVGQIVREHHGSKNGIGFNNSQSISLQPLSMLFMVVEDFVHEMMKLEKITKADLQKIVKNLSLIYLKSNYKKAVEALYLIVDA